MNFKLTYSHLLEIESQIGNSFFIFNNEKFKDNIDEFKKAFTDRYDNIRIGYSFKTNYLPKACKTAKEKGLYAEVVSGMEYELAEMLGYKGHEIIFNGPLKAKAELYTAFNNNSTIHFDSYQEIEILKDYLEENTGAEVKCALRCNFDINEDKRSRFGFELDEAKEVYKELFQLKGCNPIGVHCHFSTRERSVKSYQIRARKLIDFAKIVFEGKKLHFIDVGGGYFGKIPESIRSYFDFEVPSYNDYAESICNEMSLSFPYKSVALILEPGVALIADTMNFYCKVASEKLIKNRNIFTLTGGVHNIRPTGTGGDNPFDVISINQNNKVENALIGGYTCMESDIIHSNYSGELSVGDYLMFSNMGAYNIVFKPPFIKESPAIIMINDSVDDLVILKRKETVQDIFNSYII